jgi:hypothetical protein
MKKYRKRPVVIEAEQYKPEETKLKGVVTITDKFGTYGKIVTMEGTMRAMPGDWIIRGVDNELYPCKPHIFEKTYEPVE